MSVTRDELALVRPRVEAVDHGQRPLGRRIDVGYGEEFEIPLLQASAGGVAIGLGRGEQADRLDLGQYAGFVRRGFRARFVELAETGGDAVAQLLIAEFVVQFRAIARALDIDRESLSKRSRRLQYDHAVGKQKGLVHIIGDKDDGLALLRANTLDLRLQLRPGQRIEARKSTRMKSSH